MYLANGLFPKYVKKSNNEIAESITQSKVDPKSSRLERIKLPDPAVLVRGSAGEAQLAWHLKTHLLQCCLCF